MAVEGERLQDKGTASGHAYTLAEVQRLLRMPRSAVLALVRSGFVQPARGARRAYLFTFRDLIALRTARVLRQARLPARRINRALKDLRRRLPESLPLTGLAIRAVGNEIVVHDGAARWQADSGQYLLDLDVRISDGQLTLLDHPSKTSKPIGRNAAANEAEVARQTPSRKQESAEHWFHKGWELEEEAPQRAIAAYRRALDLDPAHVSASINLGRLLHQLGALTSAERVYRKALRRHSIDSVLLFNFAVLLEDLGRPHHAIEQYREALQRDPRFADCHYNLSMLYERTGNKLGAIRHLREYRK